MSPQHVLRTALFVFGLAFVYACSAVLLFQEYGFTPWLLVVPFAASCAAVVAWVAMGKAAFYRRVTWVFVTSCCVSLATSGISVALSVSDVLDAHVALPSAGSTSVVSLAGAVVFGLLERRDRSRNRPEATPFGDVVAPWLFGGALTLLVAAGLGLYLSTHVPPSSWTPAQERSLLFTSLLIGGLAAVSFIAGISHVLPTKKSVPSIFLALPFPIAFGGLWGVDPPPPPPPPPPIEVSVVVKQQFAYGEVSIKSQAGGDARKAQFEGDRAVTFVLPKTWAEDTVTIVATATGFRRFSDDRRIADGATLKLTLVPDVRPLSVFEAGLASREEEPKWTEIEPLLNVDHSAHGGRKCEASVRARAADLSDRDKNAWELGRSASTEDPARISMELTKCCEAYGMDCKAPQALVSDWSAKEAKGEVAREKARSEFIDSVKWELKRW